MNLSELHAFAAKLAIDAGSYLREQAISRAYPTAGPAYDLEMVIKENAADLVTKADLHAEQMISEAIRHAYPDHQIIGEESYSAGQAKNFLLTEVSNQNSTLRAVRAAVDSRDSRPLPRAPPHLHTSSRH